MLVNGENIPLSSLKKPDIFSLLEYLKLSKERIALEHNKKIIKKKDYGSVKLEENDKIEILHFVGGG